MKKLTSFITALAVSLALSISAGAESQLINAPTENGCLAFLHDIDDSLTAEDEEKLIFTVSKAAERIEMNVGVLITNKIDSTDFTEIIEYSENYFAETCGEGADGIMLLINNSTYLNWIATSGKGTDVYLPYSAEIMTNMSESFTAGDFYSSVEIFCDDIVKYNEEYPAENDTTELETDYTYNFEPDSLEYRATYGRDFDYVNFEPSIGMYTISIDNNISLLHDLDNSLSSEEEERLILKIIQTSTNLDGSVAVVITDDIGQDKSDYGVMDFADVYYEDWCGMDTDGILLLLNNDTKYDWISTSGDFIERYEYDIDYIFDDIWDYVTDGEYATAVNAFCGSIEKYNSYNDYNYNDYSDNDGYHTEIIIENVFSISFVAIFVIVIAIIIFSSVVTSGYKLSKNKSAANYMLENSLHFSQRSDTYLRTYTTRTRIQSSSSGSSGGRRSSGSHRSSGGGRHGGGGRRR